MSIISKTNRNGVDVALETLQQRLYPKLLAYWDGTATYDMFPRANKNHIDGEIYPQISLDEKDYQDVLFNDKFSVTSFFIVNNTRGYSTELGQTTHKVSLIFQADLVALYGQTNRADEQFNMDVLRELSRESLYINVDTIEVIETPNDVYSDFTFNQGTFDKLRIQDFSQHHVVRFNFDITYRINCVPSVVPVCSPVTITENNVFLEFVPSGGTFNYNTSADPAANQVNGVSQTDIPSGGSKNFIIRYEDDSPVTVTTISDSATEFIGEVPNNVSGIAYIRDGWTIQNSNNTTGDLGWYLANTTEFDYNVNGITPILDPSDRTKLLTDNAFGNKELWTNDLGGTVLDGSDGSTVNYGINHYLGLGFDLTLGAPGTLNFATAYALVTSSTFAGYNDWRHITRKELDQINQGNTAADGALFDFADFSSSRPFFWTLNTVNATTCVLWGGKSFGADNNSYYLNFGLTTNTSNASLIPVRKHY